MAIDVTEASFETDVIEASAERPVVVDFWAEWCGPCRTLGPVLEKAADARQGKVVLAKVDTDANPGLAMRFQTASIPAVKAFRDGEVVSEFLGAQPPARVEQFFDGLLPSEADELVGSGDEESLRRALELEPSRADAALPLARLLHERGDDEEAATILARVSGSFEADGLAAHIELERDADPPLAAALKQLDAGESESGLEALLQLLEGGERDDGEANEADAPKESEQIRRVIVGVLAELGQGDPAAREYRRRLAAALY